MFFYSSVSQSIVVRVVQCWLIMSMSWSLTSGGCTCGSRFVFGSTHIWVRNGVSIFWFYLIHYFAHFLNRCGVPYIFHSRMIGRCCFRGSLFDYPQLVCRAVTDKALQPQVTYALLSLLCWSVLVQRISHPRIWSYYILTISSWCWVLRQGCEAWHHGSTCRSAGEVSAFESGLLRRVTVVFDLWPYSLWDLVWSSWGFCVDSLFCRYPWISE